MKPKITTEEVMLIGTIIGLAFIGLLAVAQSLLQP